MGKKKSGNGYYAFVLDYQRKYECSRADAERSCAAMWPQLSPMEKETFKTSTRESLARKPKRILDSYGNPVKTIEEQQRKVDEEKSFTADFVEHAMCLGPRRRGDSHYGINVNRGLIAMHVNMHCVTEEGKVLPAEIAAVRFTLADGVVATFHQILRHSSIPMGYKRAIIDNSRKTHNINHEAFNGEEDFDLVGKQLLDFLMCSGNLDPVFTVESEKETTSKVLELFVKADEDVRVCDLAIAFSMLAKTLEERSGVVVEKEDVTLATTQTMAETTLLQDPFLFRTSAGDSCEFHQALENVEHCSLSIAKRRAFTILDQVSRFLRFSLTPANHLPSEPRRRTEYEDHLAEEARQKAILKEHVNPFGTEVARCGSMGGHTSLPHHDPAPIMAKAIRDNELKVREEFSAVMEDSSEEGDDVSSLRRGLDEASIDERSVYTLDSD